MVVETGIKDLQARLDLAADQKRLPISLAGLLKDGGTIRRELAEDFIPYFYTGL